MLTRLFARGLQMELGGQRLEWRSPSDLDVQLRARTGLSAHRIASLGRLDARGLARETERIGRLQERIDSLLRDAGRDFLDNAELADVPDDQEWPAILAGLREVGADGAEWRLTALRRFAEYLATGLDLLSSLRGARGGGEAAVAPRASRAEDADETHGGLLRQKLLFDVEPLRAGDATADDLARLPKGETVAIVMQPHQSLAIMLARYRFLVVCGSPFLLVDDTGNDVKLPVGKCVVGRSMEADVTVDAAYRAVSRRHLMVETGADGLLRLTDISSLGSFVPKEYLGKILH